jgi:hypothetical protein
MSPTKPELEDVLFAFSVEPRHDKSTLERYLRNYPQFVENLIDLSHELRMPGRSPSEVTENEGVFQRAWNQIKAASPTAKRDATNPFVQFQGVAFVSLAKTLRVPRSLVIVFRDRLVELTSVPEVFLARLAKATGATVADIKRYLELPAVGATAVSYKSDQKPATAQEKVTFEALVDASGVTKEEKTDIFTAAE